MVLEMAENDKCVTLIQKVGASSLKAISIRKLCTKKERRQHKLGNNEKYIQTR